MTKIKQVWIPVFFNVLLVLCSGTGIAQKSSSSYTLHLDLPAMDFPFNRDAAGTKQLFDNYSMQQALAVTQNFHNTNYYFNNKLWHKVIPPNSVKNKVLNRIAANATSGLVDYAFTYYGVVFSPQWLHEEFHRNGLTIRGIPSYNETYNRLNGGYANGSISQVKDEDLIRFKKEAPVEMVRSFAAGIESEYLLLRDMQKDNFFRHTAYPNILMNILLTHHAVGYVNQFRRKDYNHSIDLMNQHGSVIRDRDYVGWDFTPWVYDLHRPDEPYEARGRHPSGEGIDRAIKTTKLNREEYQYLEKIGKMQYLNFVTPFMVGINKIRIDSSTSFNFALRHYLNGFGYDLTMDVFLQRGEKHYLLALHKYANKGRWFPGLEVEYAAFNYIWAGRRLSLSPGAMLWLQPQDFYSQRGRIGGQFKAKATLALNGWLNIYTVLEGKSKGWVAGNPYLADNLGLRMGLHANLN